MLLVWAIMEDIYDLKLSCPIAETLTLKWHYTVLPGCVPRLIYMNIVLLRLPIENPSLCCHHDHLVWDIDFEAST